MKHQSPASSPPNLEDAHPHRVGFLLLKGDQGRAPSAPPSFPPKSIRRRLPLQLRAWEGLGRGKGEGRARGREALEFLSRRRRILKNRDTRDSRENQRRFRGGLGGIRTPVRPSAATLLSLSTCIFGCIFPCIVRLPPPPPRFQARTAHEKRHHPPPASLVSGWCRFYVCSGIYEGAGAGVEWVLRRSVREVLEVVQRVR